MAAPRGTRCACNAGLLVIHWPGQSAPGGQGGTVPPPSVFRVGGGGRLGRPSWPKLDTIGLYQTFQGTSGLALFGQTTAAGETPPRPARCAAPVLLRGLRIALRSAAANHHRPGPPDPQGTGELGPGQRSHSPLPQAGSCTRGGRLVPCLRPVSCPVLAGLISPHVSPLVSCPSICVQRGAPKNGASLGLISSWYFRATVCGY